MEHTCPKCLSTTTSYESFTAKEEADIRGRPNDVEHIAKVRCATCSAVWRVVSAALPKDRPGRLALPDAVPLSPPLPDAPPGGGRP
jgi:hypothetical protein